MRYSMGDFELELEVGDKVFRPTSTSQMLAQAVEVPVGATVLDLGCGVGPLAIVAALKGAGKVYAVDIMEDACDYARLNAQRNGVADRVEVLSGDLFAPVSAVKFDVIIDDVSGMAEEPARLSPWFPDSVPTGGYDGAEKVTEMLSEVKDHLTPDGMLYFPILSLSNARRIKDRARQVFGDHLQQLASVRIPFCTELKEHINELMKMRDAGIVDFITQNSRHLWTLEIYKASTGGPV